MPRTEPPAQAMPDDGASLPDEPRRLHRALLDGLLARGDIPSPEASAATTGLSPNGLAAYLATLVAADYLALDARGRPVCLYPFAAQPTPHEVVFDDRRCYAMCAIDALGVAAMLGRPVVVEGCCARCGAPIRLDVRPGVITRAEPAATLVVARRGGDEPAAELCCPFTVFACGAAHGQELFDRISESAVVPLAEALGHAETIFGDLLGDVLPARRRRSPATVGRLRT